MPYNKTTAIRRLQEDPRLREIIALEPELQSCIDGARAQRDVAGYNRIHQRNRLGEAILPLVGLQAKNPHLRKQEDFEAVMEIIDALLPLDAQDRLNRPPIKKKKTTVDKQNGLSPEKTRSMSTPL